MDTSSAGPIDAAATRAAIERELGLVRSAVLMVGERSSRRVTVANLSFGEQLLAEAEVMARAGGVRVRPVWSVLGSSCDIIVEARDP